MKSKLSHDFKSKKREDSPDDEHFSCQRNRLTGKSAGLETKIERSGRWKTRIQ